MEKSKTDKNIPTIGVLIGRMDESYQERVWKSIHASCQSNNINFALFTARSRHSEFGMSINYHPFFNLINKNVVDGLIITSGAISDLNNESELIHLFNRFKNIPAVSLAIEIPGIPSVIVDNKTGMFDVITHLIDHHGYTKIAFIRGPAENFEANERFRAYKEALAFFKIPINPDLILPGNFHEIDGIHAVIELLDKRRVSFETLVAADDVSAIGALKELQRRGYMIPDDISVSGFDNLIEGTYFTPPLTTVNQPIEEQAKQAVNIILDMINGIKPPMQTILPTQMIIRESCGCKVSYNDKPAPTSKNYDQDFVINDISPEQYKSIIDKITPRFVDSDETKILCRQWIKELLDTLLIAIKNKNHEKELLSTLNNILLQTIMYNQSVDYWKIMLSQLLNELKKHITDYYHLYKTEHIFNLMYELIDNIINREREKYKLNMEKVVSRLHEASQNLITAFDLKKLQKIIISSFPSLGINTFHIILYNIKDNFFIDNLPSQSNIFISYINNKLQFIPDIAATFDTRTLLPEELINNESSYSQIILPIYFVNEHFGYMIFEYGPKESMIYETVRSQLSSAIKGAYLFEARKKSERKLKIALMDLQILNKTLLDQTIKDELTGLYNRRGFINFGNEYMTKTRITKSTFILFYADLDGLKLINDEYGHNEGDKALKYTAKILKKSLRQTDIIARLGGDEFVFLTPHATLSNTETIKAHICHNFETFNNSTQKPYSLSISIGATYYNGNEDITFDELMEIADKKLYEQKKEKRKKKKHIGNTDPDS